MISYIYPAAEAAEVCFYRYIQNSIPVRQPCAKPRGLLPSKWGFPFSSISYPPNMIKQKEKQRKNKGKEHFVGRAPPTLLSLRQSVRPTPPSRGSSTISSASLSSSSRDVRLTISPTQVSRRKSRTAGVALSLWKSVLMEGARGCFHPHAFPTLLHIFSL